MTQQTQNTIGDIVSWSTFLGKKYGLYFFVLTLFSICLSDGHFFCNIYFIWFKCCYYCISLVELVIYHAFRSLSFTYSVLSLAQKLRLEHFVENKKALGVESDERFLQQAHQRLDIYIRRIKQYQLCTLEGWMNLICTFGCLLDEHPGYFYICSMIRAF